MNTWQFHLSNWQRTGPMWIIRFCLHWITCLRILILFIALNLPLLAFCFLYVVDPNQTCLSSISPLGLFRGSYVTLRDRPLFISCVVWKWCSGFRYLTDTGVSRNIVPEKRQHIFTIFNLEDKCSWKSFEWWDNGMEREEGRKWNLYT